MWWSIDGVRVVRVKCERCARFWWLMQWLEVEIVLVLGLKGSVV